MAYRRWYPKRYRRRRRYRPRFRKWRPRRALKPQGPNQQLVKLRYHDAITLDAGAVGTHDAHTFMANSIYDPDVSGTGHQPRGRDEWTALYSYYNVVGAKITIRTRQATPALTIALQLSGEPESTFTTVQDIMESRNVRSAMLGGDGQPKQLTMKFSQRKFFNIKQQKDFDTGAEYNANPQNRAYFNIYAWTESATDPAAIIVDVMIDFIVLFSDPVIPAQS